MLPLTPNPIDKLEKTLVTYLGHINRPDKQCLEKTAVTYLSHIDNLEKTVVTGPGLVIQLGGGAASAPVLPSGWCALCSVQCVVCTVQCTVPVERHPLIDLPGVQEVRVLRQDVVALHQGRHLPGLEQNVQTGVHYMGVRVVT